MRYQSARVRPIGIHLLIKLRKCQLYLMGVCQSFNLSSVSKLFRPHSAGGCYQTGYMASGNLYFVETKACPNGPPKGGVWFPVSVTVRGQEVQVYYSGVLVATVKAHFALRARGGVFTFHGYQNVVLFRKFQIAPQISVNKRCKQVMFCVYKYNRITTITLTELIY